MLLLKHGADVNARDGEATTALMQAVLGVDPDIVRLLLEKGADVNMLAPPYENRKAVTPLAAAKLTLYRGSYFPVTMRMRQIIQMLKVAGAKE